MFFKLPGESAYLAALRQSIKKVAIQKGYKTTSITQGILREEVALTDQVSNNVRQDFFFDAEKRTVANPLRPTEIMLTRGDIFVASHVGFFLSRYNTAAPGQDVLQTFPNPRVFNDAGAVVANLEAIYNGRFEVLSNQGQNYTTFPMLAFRRVPNLQGLQASATALPAGNANQVLTSADYLTEFDYGAGMVRIDPLTIRGDQETRITVGYSTWAGIDLTPTAPAITWNLVAITHGYLLKNALKTFSNEDLML